MDLPCFDAHARLCENTTVSFIFGRRCSGKTTLAQQLIDVAQCEEIFILRNTAVNNLHTLAVTTRTQPRCLVFDECSRNVNTNRWSSNVLLDFRGLINSIHHPSAGTHTTFLLCSQCVYSLPNAIQHIVAPDYVFVTSSLSSKDVESLHRFYVAPLHPTVSRDDLSDMLGQVTAQRRVLVIARDGFYWTSTGCQMEALEKRVEALETLFDRLYSAPGMPGRAEGTGRRQSF